MHIAACVDTIYILVVAIVFYLSYSGWIMTVEMAK